jgi:hypothetical protein
MERASPESKRCRRCSRRASAVLTVDTYVGLFPDDLELAAVPLDDARLGALDERLSCSLSRGGGI